MFYYFFIPLIEKFNFLNLFNYLTFRAGGALFTAFTVSLILGPRLIKTLKNIQNWLFTPHKSSENAAPTLQDFMSALKKLQVKAEELLPQRLGVLRSARVRHVPCVRRCVQAAKCALCISMK